MDKSKKSLELPWINWAGVVVSLTMTLLYLQRLAGPDAEPHTTFVTGVWVLMLTVWLASAVYKTWFSR